MKPSELYELAKFEVPVDSERILRALDAHHASTQAQIAALEKRVAELEKGAQEMGRRTAGLVTYGGPATRWEQIIDVTKLGE